MNKIIVEVSVGELLDKISILEIKKEKIKDAEKLKFINILKKLTQNFGLSRMIKDNVRKKRILGKNLLSFQEMFIF